LANPSSIGGLPQQQGLNMLSSHQHFRQKTLAAVIFLCLLAIPTMAKAQQETAQQKSPKNAYIVNYCVEGVAEGSGYETGPIRITYSDGTHLSESLPPLDFNEVAITNPKLASDKQTLGWTVNLAKDMSGASYSIEYGLVVYKSGKIIHKIYPGQFIWDWMFVDGGKQVALIDGFSHGRQQLNYQLYDVATGKLISKVHDDEETEQLPAKAPRWAKQLEHQRQKQTPRDANVCTE